MSPKGENDELFRELLAGLVVSLATIPTSVSYSSIIGLSPLVGIWTSCIVGLVVTVVGGGPGLIAGAAGVIALPMAKLVEAHGTQYMAAAVILSGLMETLFGVFRLGKLASLVTEPVIAGFLNAFALFLIRSQLKVFRTASGAWLPPALMAPTAGIALLCLGIARWTPSLLRKAQIPASLAAVVGSSLASRALRLPLKSLADSMGRALFVGGAASLPVFQGLPKVPLSLKTLQIVFSTAFGASIIGILETILAERIACDSYRCRVSVYEQDDPDRTVVGLGLGNMASALFGGFGGCGLIPNTLLNGSSGGLGYASGFAYSACLALAVGVFSPLIGAIPMAALAGLMLNVALGTFEGEETLRALRLSLTSPQRFLDLLALLTTTVLCFRVDMGLGVLAGVVLAQATPLWARVTSGFAAPVTAVRTA